MADEIKVLLFLILFPAWLLLVPLAVRVWPARRRIRLSRRARRWAALLLMGAAVALTERTMAVLADWKAPAWNGLAYLSAAALCFAAALLARPWPVTPAANERVSLPRERRVVRLGLALLPGSALALWLLQDLARQGKTNNLGEFGLWALAIVLYVAGVVPPRAWRAGWRGLCVSWRRRRAEWLLVLAVTLGALGVRVLRLGSALPVLFGDESPFSVDAMQIAKGLDVTIFVPGHQGHPWIFPVMQAPFVALLGRTLLAVRIWPVIFGTLTIPATYLLAREMFDRRIAAAAAAFLAGYPIHVHFSRIGINNIIDPFFGTLALALLLCGLRNGSRAAFAFAGVALGLGEYFYSGGRLLLVLVGGYLVYLLLFRRDVARARWRGLLAMAGAAAVTVWPAFYHLYTNGVPLIYRARLTSVIESADGPSLVEQMIEAGQFREFLADQLRDSFLGYIQTPDRFHFYAGQTAMLLPPAALLFLLGVMWALWRLRGGLALRARGPEALLLAWVALTALLGGATMRMTPGYARYVIVTPALAVLAALGLALTLDFFARWVARRGWVNAALAACLVVISAAGVNYYFVRHLDDLMDSLKPETWEVRDLRQRIAALPADTEVHIISSGLNMHFRGVIRYFDGDRTVIYHEEEAVDWRFLDTLVSERHYIFFVQGTRMADLETLQRSLPGGRLLPPPYVLRAGLAYVGYEVGGEW
ncbi:MAG: glycosyltransferase family 39 protein [Anaerolineae bacterium]|nr:glycosyltransferase family 39 protein [Anaerolineae bacterium]